MTKVAKVCETNKFSKNCQKFEGQKNLLLSLFLEMETNSFSEFSKIPF